MLVKPTYKRRWDIPGGYVEVAETPREACIREVLEELALDVRLSELLVVDWAPHPNEGDKVLFVFDGGVLSGDQRDSIRLQTEELSEYRYQDPGDVTDLLSQRLARRISAAAQARSRGCPKHLEHGEASTASERDRTPQT